MPAKRKAESGGSTPEDSFGGVEIVPPEDPSFLATVQDSTLQAIVDDVLTQQEGDPSIRLEQLEMKLRRSILQKLQDSTEGLGEFWLGASRLCLHLVFMSEESKDERFNGLNARKIPFVLLEDIFDCLSSDDCGPFWHKYCLGAFQIIFGQRIWLPSPTQHPCWLPFLKISNKLIRRLPAQDSGSILLTLCRVFPLSERSGTRWGSHNAANVTLFEDAEEFETEQSRIGSDEKMTAESLSNTDYSFYESFWKLQEDLNHPNGLHAAAVPSFLNRLKSLITALESHSVFSHASSCDTGPKYLTGSNLMAYQLKDPEFRIHILSQILIVCQHMSAAGPTLRTKLKDWDARSRKLLKDMEPDGSKHLDLLNAIFARSEEAWRKWKKEKCQEDLDKTHSEPLENRKKRKSLGGSLGSTTEEDEDEASQALVEGVLDPSELAEASKQIRGLLPSIGTHMSDYVEALDPEAGIEAEYHPKNDKLFSWRALRIMSRDHLGRLPLVNVDGDFEGLVRRIYKEERGIEIPGDYPAYDVDDFEEREEEMMEDDVPENLASVVEPTDDEIMEETDPQSIAVSEDVKVHTEATEVKENGDDSNEKDKGMPGELSVENGTEMDVENEEAAESKQHAQKVEDVQEPSKNEHTKAPLETTRVTVKSPPPDAVDERTTRPKFTPPPGKAIPSLKYTDIDKPPPQGNGTKRREESKGSVEDTGDRRARGGPGGGGGGREGRGRGSGDRGRNQAAYNERGPPYNRDDRSRVGKEDRRSPSGRDGRGPSSKNERVPISNKGERAPPPRRDDHWTPPGGRGHGREERRAAGGRGGGGGGPPPERWDDQRRRRDERLDDRRDGDERRSSRRRHRN